MPILKTDILGTSIEINYRDGELDKLEKIIINFKNRLKEFEIHREKVSDSKIIFLAALKVEDKLEDLNNLFKKNLVNKNKILEQKTIIKQLRENIIILKKNINEIVLNNSSQKDLDLNVIEEITKLDNKLILIQKKI